MSSSPSELDARAARLRSLSGRVLDSAGAAAVRSPGATLPRREDRFRAGSARGAYTRERMRMLTRNLSYAVFGGGGLIGSEFVLVVIGEYLDSAFE